MASIKAYPTSQRLIDGMPEGIPGYPTAQPSEQNLRMNLDVISRGAFRVGGNTVRVAGALTGNPSSGPSQVVDTSTPALVGDFVRFIDGDAAFMDIPIVAVQVNAFQLGCRLIEPPAPGDSFYIMRYATPRTDDTGSLLVSLTLPDYQPVDFTSLQITALAPVTTAAYLTLTAAVADDVAEVEVDNSTGRTLVLAVGAAGLEVNKLIVFPKGLSRQLLTIASGARISLKSLHTNATVGEVNINYFG